MEFRSNVIINELNMLCKNEGIKFKHARNEKRGYLQLAFEKNNKHFRFMIEDERLELDSFQNIMTELNYNLQEHIMDRMPIIIKKVKNICKSQNIVFDINVDEINRTVHFWLYKDSKKSNVKLTFTYIENTSLGQTMYEMHEHIDELLESAAR